MKILYGLGVVFVLGGLLWWYLDVRAVQAPTTTDDTTVLGASNADAKADVIVVDTPQPNATVSSPLTITGRARGYWFFEASFPIVVTDWDGKIIGQGHAEAQDSWMTEDFVPFVATIEFTVPADTAYRRGTLILQKDNPSGLPEHDDALEVPVLF
jgi:hypothetical protein